MSNSGDEVAKKGCAGCLGCLTVVIVIPWIILLIVYFCFSKTAENAVCGVSLQDGIYSALLTINDRDDADARKRKKAYVKHLASRVEGDTGVDISEPIYQVLRKSEQIADLSVRCLNKCDGEGLYAISYKIGEKKYQLQFVARDASLLNKEFGSAEYVGGHADDLVRRVGAFYNIPPEEVRTLEALVRPRVPNN